MFILLALLLYKRHYTHRLEIIAISGPAVHQKHIVLIKRHGPGRQTWDFEVERIQNV